MANKQEELQQKYQSLRTAYYDLEDFYYANFRMKPKGSTKGIISFEHYHIECTQWAKDQLSLLQRRFKTYLADALDALDSYKSGFFSDKEYAGAIQSRIRELTGNNDKILFYLSRFDIVIK